MLKVFKITSLFVLFTSCQQQTAEERQPLNPNNNSNTNPGAGQGVSTNPGGNTSGTNAGQASQTSPGQDIVELNEQRATFFGGFDSWFALKAGNPIYSAAHHGALVKIYLNKLAEDHAKKGSTDPYPPGAIFTKAKITESNHNSRQAEKIFMMEKSADGKWIYSVGKIDSAGKMEALKFNLKMCVDCHNTYEKHDYVFSPKVHADSLGLQITQTQQSGLDDEKAKKLGDFASWQALNNGSVTPSSAHKGISVKIFLNDKAKDHAKKRNNDKYPEGSIFAKAKLADNSTDAKKADKVFIMEKIKDSEWDFYVGKVNGDKMELIDYDKQMCVDCHKQYSNQDQVISIKIFPL